MVTFELGSVVATPGAMKALQQVDVNPMDYLIRHRLGDWGEMDAEDSRANDLSVLDGTRIMSAYTLPSGVKIWIITEGDRSATTFLLPEEY